MAQWKRYSVARGLENIGQKVGLLLASAGVLFGSGLALSLAGVVSADNSSINFESSAYTVGNINGQNGWSKTGGYDVAVVPNTYGYPSFGGQSLRLSNSVTSGSFGDQTFAPKLSQPAGEADALDINGNPVASPKPHFEAQFDIASVTKTNQGMSLSVSPDRGDGARMSYLRFVDMSDGIHVYFDDVTDPSHVQNADTFNETDIATLSYTATHNIKFSMDFFNGPDNDVVRVYIDGNLAVTGTSWEDYYRFDQESNPGLTHNDSRVVDTLLFREGGSAVPSNAGNGYLVDNLSMLSGDFASGLPTTKDMCMKNGWQNYGSAFKNQGDCVSFIASKGKNRPTGALPQASVTHSAIGNLALSGPEQTLSFHAYDNGISANDSGWISYANPGVGLSYTVPPTCVNVSGSTAYFSYQIPADAPVAANTWVVWKVTDGSTDTAGFTTASDGNSARALCEAGSSAVANYTITSGDVVVQ